VAVGVVFHNTIFLHQFSIKYTVLVVAAFARYAMLSWLMIYLFFERSHWFDVAGFFVVLDIPMFALAVYLSGGERSTLFFLMVMRVVDQVHTNVRQLILFTHVSILSYVGLMGYLDVFEGRPISWAMEGINLQHPSFVVSDGRLEATSSLFRINNGSTLLHRHRTTFHFTLSLPG